MKNRILKIVIILTILILGINNVIYAAQTESTDGGSSSTSSSTIDTDYYAPDSQTEVSDATRLEEIGNSIVGILRIIGSILSVAVLAIIGIKYMIGSVEERAEYKKTLLPYLIGAILVFGITNILAIVVDIATSLIG